MHVSTGVGVIYTYSSYSVVPDIRGGEIHKGALLTLEGVYCGEGDDYEVMPNSYTLCFDSTVDSFFFISDKMFKVFGAKAMYSQVIPCSES